MQIDIDIDDSRWAELGLEALCEKATEAVCAALGLEADLCELSVLGCDDARIKELNAEFRAKDKATNVLSWPAEERGAETEGDVPQVPEPDMFGTIALGDLALAYETCIREATEQQKSAQDHVLHLIIHGLLHLLGYDHVRDADAVLMEALEIRILEKQGIANPYEF
ncbi:rRNA maturation RNase YbeY [Thioclava sp. FTW29]|uniref:Endoribonuclease YbeY n=1 Tax=Thioclava litoralis TaxID=3076557 RepID=A0ABZ1E3A0_9RHOB|nr:rRNA maturation RNase YbeY [Thioclava sp. FTW29]